MKKIIIFLVLILNFLNADISQYFPKLEGRVIDEANLLSPEVKKDINNILKNEENKSSNQIVVVILNSLNGYSIEEFSYQLGRFWGIGQKDKNNGVLLVVSMKEREIRIEVGYGLEGALTDKISHEIINYTIKPNFKASQYELGILKAVNEIIKATQGEYVVKPKNTDFSSFFNITVPLGFFTLIFVSMLMNGISRKLRNQVLYKITNSSMSSSFFGFFTYVASQSFVSYSLVLALIIFVVVFIFNYINIKKVDFDKLSKIDYINSSKNSSSFGSFDSSTSGGFSGGGGSFGGGGASGRW
ncbi:TPM domain-containing protein [Aliarcobacter butzleri]|uniref:TPM domain-containing protein n=1 Tax=Aliarcobacter butzleri TaxID=28197 RepID=UPI00344FB8A8